MDGNHEVILQHKNRVKENPESVVLKIHLFLYLRYGLRQNIFIVAELHSVGKEVHPVNTSSFYDPQLDGSVSVSGGSPVCNGLQG
jgi:hypothetical protein